MQLKQVLELITQKLETMINTGDPHPIYSKRKTITALFPYILQQEHDGQHKVFNVCLHAVNASKQPGFLWYCIEELPITMLLNEESPVSVKQAFMLMSPHLQWHRFTGEHWVQLWAATASAIPYTDEIGQSVVATLLYIAYNGSLQPHIPIYMWPWLKKSPILPPICEGRFWGKFQYVAQVVQGLGDIETLTAYLLLIWSEWEYQFTDEMGALIREQFSGIRMGYYRKELLQHLDHVLEQLRQGLEYLQYHDPSISGDDDIQERQGQYRQLKEVLLEADREATDLLIGKSLKLIILLDLLNSCEQVKDITQHLCVQSLFHFCSFVSVTSPVLYVYLTGI